MAKKGRLEPKDWGSVMPVHNPLAQKAPYFYRGTEAIITTFLTDEDAALTVLPSDLELVEPATAFMVIETNHWTTVGPYSEVYVALLCTYEGEMCAYTPGVYVTGENSQILGREIWGFGKKRASRIELISHDNGEVEALVDVRPNDGAVRALMRPATNDAADTLASMPLICLRVIPDPEGSDTPSLAQLVSVLFTANPVVGSDGKAEVYSGPGSLEFGAPSDVQFPVKQIVSNQYAHFDADLPYGKILKTYSPEELPG